MQHVDRVSSGFEYSSMTFVRESLLAVPLVALHVEFDYLSNS